MTQPLSKGRARRVLWCVAALAMLASYMSSARAQSAGANRNYDLLVATYREDVPTGVAINDAGEVYVTGSASIDEFPTTAGAYRDAGWPGVIVTKFNADGTVGFTAALTGMRGEAIAVDTAGYVYVAAVDGATVSGAFVAKLSPDGSQLVYRTALGPLGGFDTRTDGGALPRLSISLDSAGVAYVGGTAGPGFQAQGAAFDDTLNGQTDGFIARVDDAGGISYVTFIGGSGADSVRGVLFDPVTGGVVVTGNSGSIDFPVTDGTVGSAAGQGGAFVLNLDGRTLRYSTILSPGAGGRALALGGNGTVWVTGTTRARTFPTTPDAYGDFNIASDYPRDLTFVTQLNWAGDIVYSSSLVPAGASWRLGDEGFSEVGDDRALTIAVDRQGERGDRVYVAGISNRHINYYSPDDNGFAFVFDRMKNTAGYGDQQFVGRGEDAIFGVAVNAHGDVVHAGFTMSYWTARYFADGGPNYISYGRDLTEPNEDDAQSTNSPEMMIVKRLAPDTDRDGIRDALDNCPAAANATQADWDADGKGDACSVQPPKDADKDTIVDDDDNCPTDWNRGQADRDADGIGDDCDPDNDNDTVPDMVDNCNGVVNPDQANADGDFFGDACDATPMPPAMSDQLSLLATIPAVGTQYEALAVAVNEQANRAYVLRSDSSIQAIDGRTQTVLATRTAIAGAPRTLAVNPVSGRVYVGDSMAGLGVLDAATLADTGRVLLDAPAESVAINAVTGRIYVMHGRTKISELDATTEQVLRTIDVLEGGNLIVDAAGNRVFFGGTSGGRVSVLDVATGAISNVPVDYAYGVPSVLGIENRYYWYGEDGTTLTIVDLATGTKTRTEWLLKFVRGTQANPRAHRIYTYGWADERYPYQFFMLNADGTVLGRLALPTFYPTASAVNTRTGVVYVADEKSLFAVRDASAVPANTQTGANVVVPTAEGTSLTFSSVITAGETTIEPIADASTLDLTLPGGFAISNAVGAFEIHTTATFSGAIEVCFVAQGLTDAEFAGATILHGVDGAWREEATRRDAATRTLCADVTSLSPFAVGVRTGACAAAPGLSKRPGDKVPPPCAPKKK